MNEKIENLLKEDRKFPPSEHLVKNANAPSSWYDEASKDRLKFWQKQALTRISWFKEPTEILDDSNPPFFKWFKDGELNLSYNCLDRHLESDGDRVAFYWEGEPGDTQEITYQDLYERVCKLSNALKKLGVEKGDRVAIYLGMTPEIVVSMLACARIGAVHSVVFGGFSSEALADRINDAKAKTVITADGAWRRGDIVPLKNNVDGSLELTEYVENVIVVKRTEQEISMTDGRDHWYHDITDKESSDCEPEVMNSEDMLYILYTSGTTAKPKGIVHTQGGYLTGVTTTHHEVFDVKEDDIYWCAADCGWVTGHSYIVYGPLANKATSVMYEGAPNAPDEKRLWSIIEKYKVNIFYTAPTAIRALMKEGNDFVTQCDLSSLRILGTVGEPINPEAWNWYSSIVGKDKCPVVDTWWQTETGGHLISPIPGVTKLKPGSATHPYFGIEAAIVDDNGNVLEGECEGKLCMLDSWPGQMRTVYGNHQRFVDTYFSQFKGKYFTGDGCRRDEDGYYWITGRVDDCINVSGHLLGTAEIESAFVEHALVSEAAVVGYPHDIKGQGIYAYVTTNTGVEVSDELKKELTLWIRQKIGPIATPDKIQFAPGLPKTRSGKIMRRILRKIASHEEDQLGDTSTLADPGVVQSLIDGSKDI